MQHQLALFAIAAAIGLAPAGGEAQVKGADSTAKVDSAGVQAAAPAAMPAATPAVTKEKPQQQKNGDKIVGKDEKGRTIYEGPRGGRYYISKSGSKVYVRKKPE